jgi:hypothetical protein
MERVLNITLNTITIVFSILSVLFLLIAVVSQFDSSIAFTVATGKVSILDILWVVILLGVIIYHIKMRQKKMLISIVIGTISFVAANFII